MTAEQLYVLLGAAVDHGFGDLEVEACEGVDGLFVVLDVSVLIESVPTPDNPTAHRMRLVLGVDR